MTIIRTNTQYIANTIFTALENIEFDTETAATVNGLEIEQGNGNDTIVLKGRDNKINAGNGNNKVVLAGDNNSVVTGNGKDSIIVAGSNNDLISYAGDDYYYVEGDNNFVFSASGNNTMEIIGDSNKAYSGNGNNTVALIGNENVLQLGNGKQYVAYWGNNNKITAGDGNSTFATFDYALQQGKFEDLESAWLETLPMNTTYTNTCNGISITASNSASYDNLSDADKKTALSLDLAATIDGKIPKYIITQDSAGQPRLYQYNYVKGSDRFYKPVNEDTTNSQNNAEVTLDAEYTKLKVSGSGTGFYTYTKSDNYSVSGVSGNTITAGDGNTNFYTTVADASNSFQFGTGNHKIEQELPYIFSDVSSKSETRDVSQDKYMYFNYYITPTAGTITETGKVVETEEDETT